MPTTGWMPTRRWRSSSLSTSGAGRSSNNLFQLIQSLDARAGKVWMSAAPVDQHSGHSDRLRGCEVDLGMIPDIDGFMRFRPRSRECRLEDLWVGFLHAFLARDDHHLEQRSHLEVDEHPLEPLFKV